MQYDCQLLPSPALALDGLPAGQEGSKHGHLHENGNDPSHGHVPQTLHVLRDDAVQAHMQGFGYADYYGLNEYDLQVLNGGPQASWRGY